MNLKYKEALETAKERIDIPRAWQLLNLPGSPSKSCSSPWRDDRHPSFSIFDDGRAFKDHATGEAGDVVSFVQTATGMNFKEAVNWLFTQAGLPTHNGHPASPAPILLPRRKTPEKQPQATLEPVDLTSLHAGSNTELSAVAESRGLHWQAALVASRMGCLRFGKVCGLDCWILTDESGRSAEARRMDRKPFPALGSLGERKAHTLKGSKKSWPVGLGSTQLWPNDNILIVEGGPDFLAALHHRFDRRKDTSRSGQGWFPVAMLGRSNSIHPDALPMFKGRKVRIYPHNDQDGGGMSAAQRWAQSVYDAGANDIDFFTFENIRTKDGNQASDLNDAAIHHPDDINKLTRIFPISTPH